MRLASRSVESMTDPGQLIPLINPVERSAPTENNESLFTLHPAEAFSPDSCIGPAKTLTSPSPWAPLVL